jgi:quercetin dioxygenase-like cupin family protein
MITEETRTLALVTNWDDVKIERPSPGIRRQMVVGERLMICRFTFDPFLITPEHTHPHEQMTLVIKGKVKFIIEGEVRIVSPGDVLYFPPHNRHGATMLDEEVVLIDIFSPIREDFLLERPDNGDEPQPKK